MTIVLGIDTGGTYTDGVLLNVESGEILANAKAATTHYDLIEGIRGVVDALPAAAYDRISYAALSTTLATNAIVEHKHDRVGLVVIGAEVDFPLPECLLTTVAGGHDIHGRETTPLDGDALGRAVEGWRGQVGSVAVSSFLSVRNPEHELAAKALIQQLLHVPVVAAHELTGSLGFAERTVTAVLNSHLLPVVDQLLHAVAAVLAEKNIRVPIMTVKGDGSLMNESLARLRPIETILSGPAASIIGATYLMELRDGLILDMGGTTSDLAILRDGRPRFDGEGARVGGWLTRVQAARVNTFGLGGDSELRYDHFLGRFLVGPRRVCPVSAAAKHYPVFQYELFRDAARPRGFALAAPTDGLMLVNRGYGRFALNETELRLVHELEDSAHTLGYLADRLGMETDLLPMKRLAEFGIVTRIGLTPTDILHFTGEFTEYDRDSAVLAVRTIAARLGFRPEQLAESVKTAVRRSLTEAVLNSAIHYENGPLRDEAFPEGMAYFLDKNRPPVGEELFHTEVRLDLPLVGIGAPVAAWLPPVAEALHTELLLPPHSDVANAVGAAAGRVMDLCRITIVSVADRSVNAFTPWARYEYPDLETAVLELEELARRRMTARMAEQDAADCEILVQRSDKQAQLLNIDGAMHIETVLDVIATGRPSWKRV